MKRLEICGSEDELKKEIKRMELKSVKDLTV